ncbi:hypothetical protein KC19_2G028800, partial [Ceratodon purpureus]
APPGTSTARDASSHHLRLWRTETLAAAAATSLIAWLFTLLAMGTACKEIHTAGYRTKRLIVTRMGSLVGAWLELGWSSEQLGEEGGCCKFVP